MRSISIYITLMISCLLSNAQNGLSFYHLGNATFQNSYYNPALIPEGKFFIGLPALSGIQINYNNKFDYSDAFYRIEDTTYINQEKFLSSLQRQNMVSVSTTINLFHLAYTHSSGINFSFFGNERVETDFLFPKSLIEFVVKGNGAMTGEVLKIGRTRLSASYFREIGIGTVIPLNRLRMTIGARLKYLQGFANVSTPNDFTADIKTNGANYGLKLNMHNATIQTSGLEIIQGDEGNIKSYLLGNKNRGMAADMGINLMVNERNSLSASLIDIGFISWKEDLENHTIGDTTMDYHGVNLKDPKNIERAIKDSLIYRFEDKHRVNHNSYTTLLGTKMYASWTYHLSPKSDLIGSSGIRYLHGRTKWLFGAGYRYFWGRYFVGSVNITRLPQQFLNLGASLAVRGGPTQMYLAVDQIVNGDLTRFKAIDARFGINFIINAKEVAGPGGLPPNKKSKHTKGGRSSFLGSKVKVKGQEGIYTLIKRQKPRTAKSYSSAGTRIPNEIDKPKDFYE